MSLNRGIMLTKSKLAFTLAEVLITLGIIGVVSAMTIPSLVGRVNDIKNDAILKEDYALMSQVVKLAESQDVAVEGIIDSASGMKLWFDNYILPNMKTVSVCYETPGCWTSGDTYTMTGSIAPSSQKGIGVGGGIIIFTLPNGSNICIDGWGQGDMKSLFGVETEGSSMTMYVDTNGSKMPNAIGKDIYILCWKNGGFVPAGADLSVNAVEANCSKYSKNSNAGYYCLRHKMLNGWKN